MSRLGLEPRTFCVQMVLDRCDNQLRQRPLVDGLLIRVQDAVVGIQSLKIV